MNIDKERKLAMWVVTLDNHIHDIFRSYISWLPLFSVTVPEFLEYYKKHGQHNIDKVLKD